MRVKTVIALIALLVLMVGSANAFIQAKILDYDGVNISYNIYYPDYDRAYNASESPMSVDIRFLIYWQYKNGREEREEFITSVDTVTNTNANFRYPLAKGLNNIKAATISLFVENQLSDTFVVNFVQAEPEH
jgi:hypothetical protein